MVGKVSRMFFWVLNPLRHVLMQSSLSFKKGCVYFMYFPGVVASINQTNSWSFRKPQFHQVKLDGEPSLQNYPDTSWNIPAKLPGIHVENSPPFFFRKSVPNIF